MTTDERHGTHAVIAPTDITGVVLCGGEGRRMGGANKPLLPLRGRPLVAHVLERLRPQVGPVLISANRDVDAYRTVGVPVVLDAIPGLGPLGGLASVMPRVSTPWIFCCPGDAPRVNDSVVARLGRGCDAISGAVYPHDGARPQYLFLLVRTTACTSLTDYLGSGARSVHGWLATIGARAVEMPDIADSFANVNTAAALAALGTEH